MKTLVIAVLAVVAVLPIARATQIAGVDVPQQVTVSGKQLQLNGAGLRKFSFLGVPVNVYVAAFYTPAPLGTAQAVFASPGPMRFDFTFLLAVDQKKVTDAWTAQFDASAKASYAGFANDRARFIGMFGPLQKGGVQTVVLNGDSTLVHDSGAMKGTIAGRDFQQAFLGMWFGANPVTPDLKAALLGK
jgi:hypothetical protein